VITTVPNPKYAPLNENDSRLFVIATLNDMADKKGEPQQPDVIQAIENEFLIQILNKRIEVMELPIKFTLGAKMAALALVDRPGGIVALLVDCLNNFEGETVDVRKLSDLYPMGWYDEDTFIRYVDEHLKPKKVKWAEVYAP
jgi:hypothetical protein